MVDVYVLDQSFNIITIIDNYESLIWRPAYYDVGDFELYLPVSVDMVNALQKNRYLVRRKDVTVDSAGRVTYKNVMIIKNITISTDSEDGDYITVSGKELKYLLHQRIVWKQTNLTGTAEAGIRKLVNENAISPTDTKRKIPLLALGSSAGLSDSIEKQLTGDYVDEAIKEICTAYNYGWDMYYYNGSIIFRVYKGVDRSFNQTDRPYVVFSEDFDNILNTEYQLESEIYANTTLVAGEGEGTARKSVTVNPNNSGLNRFEVFTDARDLSQNKDSSDPSEVISDTDYNKLLKERGTEKLAELGITEGFSGEVLSDVAFTYGIDFFIGDSVTVINKYGISRDVMVLSATESYDENGEKLIPEFNI